MNKPEDKSSFTSDFIESMETSFPRWVRMQGADPFNEESFRESKQPTGVKTPDINITGSVKKMPEDTRTFHDNLKDSLPSSQAAEGEKIPGTNTKVLHSTTPSGNREVVIQPHEEVKVTGDQKPRDSTSQKSELKQVDYKLNETSDKPTHIIHEKPVYIVTQKPVYFERPVYIERPVEKPVMIEKTVDRPVYVEKVIEKPVVIEKTVERPVYFVRETLPPSVDVVVRDPTPELRESEMRKVAERVIGAADTTTKVQVAPPHEVHADRMTTSEHAGHKHPSQHPHFFHSTEGLKFEPISSIKKEPHVHPTFGDISKMNPDGSWRMSATDEQNSSETSPQKKGWLSAWLGSNVKTAADWSPPASPPPPPRQTKKSGTTTTVVQPHEPVMKTPVLTTKTVDTSTPQLYVSREPPISRAGDALYSLATLPIRTVYAVGDAFHRMLFGHSDASNDIDPISRSSVWRTQEPGFDFTAAASSSPAEHYYRFGTTATVDVPRDPINREAMLFAQFHQNLSMQPAGSNYNIFGKAAPSHWTTTASKMPAAWHERAEWGRDTSPATYEDVITDTRANYDSLGIKSSVTEDLKNLGQDVVDGSKALVRDVADATSEAADAVVEGTKHVANKTYDVTLSAADKAIDKAHDWIHDSETLAKQPERCETHTPLRNTVDQLFVDSKPPREDGKSWWAKYD